MATTKRDGSLEYPSHRAKLKARREPYWFALEKGRSLGYRKGATGGTWIARIHSPELNRPRMIHALGLADDFGKADGQTVLNYSQAQERARKWFTQVLSTSSGEETPSGPFTVEAAWIAYRRDCERRGMKSLSQTESAALAHILPDLGGVEVAKLTQGRIERWHENLANSPARVRSRYGAKQAATRPGPVTDDEKRARKDTSNRVLTILKAFLNYAKRRRLTAATGEAWREARPFKDTTSNRVRTLTAEESQRLVNVCPPDFRRLVKGALFTGTRFGELVRLQVRDFDPKAGTVFVSESKSGKPRHVVLTEEGAAFFAEVTTGKKSNALMFRRDEVERRSRTGLEDTHSWQKGDQNRHMADACEKAGLEGLSFHELRHSYASSLVNAGVPLAFIAEQLGHSGTRMVEKHYGHLALSAKAEAIRKLAPRLGIHKPSKVAALKIKKA